MKGRSFLIRHSKTLEERYIGNAYIFTEKEAGRLLKNSRRPDTMKVTAPIYERVKDKDPVTKMQYLDMHLWLVHDILMKGDKMGMANSLEVRVPFLDKEVMEVAQSLPLKYKIDAPRTKIALRAAADREIRSYTAEKKKLGFPIPIRVWLKEDQYYNRVRAMFETKEAEQFFDTAYLKKLLEEHRAGKFDNSRKIWTVYISCFGMNAFCKWETSASGDEQQVEKVQNRRSRWQYVGKSCGKGRERKLNILTITCLQFDFYYLFRFDYAVQCQCLQFSGGEQW